MATTIERPINQTEEKTAHQSRMPGERRHVLSRAALYTLLSIFGVIAAVPFVWMILASFKSGAELRQIPPTVLATGPDARQLLDDPSATPSCRSSSSTATRCSSR